MQQFDDPVKGKHVDGMGPAILVGLPGHELCQDRRLASIVHETQRPDLAFRTPRQLGKLLEFLRARFPFLMLVGRKAVAQVGVERLRRVADNAASGPAALRRARQKSQAFRRQAPHEVLGLPLPARLRDDRVQVRQPSAHGTADVPSRSLERGEPRHRPPLFEYGDLHVASNVTDGLRELGRQKRIAQQRLSGSRSFAERSTSSGGSPPRAAVPPSSPKRSSSGRQAD